MPEMSTEGTGFASLEAKVIRADGTEEDLGVIAQTSRRFVCESAAAWIEFTGTDVLPPLPSAFLQRGEIVTVLGPYIATVTEGTIRELKGEED